MSFYLSVVEQEGDEPVELPLNENGTLSLSNLVAQFPGASGLKYRNQDTGTFRGVRFQDDCFYPTDGVWQNVHYIAVFPKDNKRKGEEGLENPLTKAKKTEVGKCSDLIVLGLPWKSTEEDLRKYFSAFGELLMVQVKKDSHTGQSKGFGFVRYATLEAQRKCITQRHLIDGRWCDVRIPNSKGESMDVGGSGEGMSNKVFVGRCTENITADDLRLYFSQFGEVTDVFIPKPFRAFAFVSFANPRVAKLLCDDGDDHIIHGASVYVSSAAPKGARAPHLLASAAAATSMYSDRMRVRMSPPHAGSYGGGGGYGLTAGAVVKHGSGAGQVAAMGGGGVPNANYPYMLSSANVAMLAAAALAQGWGQIAGGFAPPDASQSAAGPSNNPQMAPRGFDASMQQSAAGGAWSGAATDGTNQWRGEMKPAGWN